MASSESPTIVGSPGKPQGDLSETTGTTTELERLANLRDRGALTNEEFEVEKRKLLNS
jgi:Short C-terminal domain